MDFATAAHSQKHAFDPRSPAELGESARAGVSWSAVAAGAAGAAALSLILLVLGVGLGLSAVSPWSGRGAGAASLGVSAIAWLTFSQILASVLGGYLAGRLRMKWTVVHSDEVYFRDTAHGFLAWAVASLITASVLASASASILSGGAQAGAAVAGGALNTARAALQGSDTGSRFGQAGDSDPIAYYIDAMLRPSMSGRPGSAGIEPGVGDSAEQSAARDTTELARIFRHAGLMQPLPAEDVQYAGQLVASRTGVSQADAEKRVTDIYARAQAGLHDAEATAQAAADQARKASAYASLWLFVCLLVGAFVASLAATFGGRLRDR